MLADMDEVWALLGIAGCVACCCPDAALGDLDLQSPPRTFADAIAVIETCRAWKLQRGNADRVDKLLATKRLNAFHLLESNPFFHLPHADVECFPMDWLHGMCATLLPHHCLSSACISRFTACVYCVRRVVKGNVPYPICSDLGVLKHHIEAVSAWIMHTVQPAAAAHRQLARLSKRVEILTAAIPGVPTVYGLFVPKGSSANPSLPKGPTLQGPHFR